MPHAAGRHRGATCQPFAGVWFANCQLAITLRLKEVFGAHSMGRSKEEHWLENMLCFRVSIRSINSTNKLCGICLAQNTSS